MFIIDFGSGNTCRNDWLYAKRMLDEFYKVFVETKSKKEIVLKWQLFIHSDHNVPLSRKVFERALFYSWSLGFQTTASVFDETSLNFLLDFEIPFVKIANQEKSKKMKDFVPEDYKIIESFGEADHIGLNSMCCVSKYPATVDDYEKVFFKTDLKKGISDHTKDWTLYKKYQPKIYECHFKLEDSEGLDAGAFARTPAQLKEVL